MTAQHISLAVFLGLIVALYVSSYFFGNDLGNAARSSWRGFADERDLKFQPGEAGMDYGRVEGTLGGRDFAMWTFESTEGSDTRAQGTVTRTRMLLRPAGMPDGFTMSPRQGSVGQAMENMAVGLAARLGAAVPPTVLIGDASFDENWVVRGHDAVAVQAWLGPIARREALIACFDEPHLDSWEDAIRWEGMSPDTPEEIAEIVALLESHAERIEHP